MLLHELIDYLEANGDAIDAYVRETRIVTRMGEIYLCSREGTYGNGMPRLLWSRV